MQLFISEFDLTYVSLLTKCHYYDIIMIVLGNISG